MKKTIGWLIVIAMIIGMGFLLKGAIEKSEKLECVKWQGWAKEYPNFYTTQWQKDQCDHYNLIIEAPVSEQPALEEPEYTEIFAIIYAYSSEPEQTDSDPETMASGNKVYDGAIACPEFVAFGIKVEVLGKEYTCEDRMGEYYRDKNYFDIWMPTKEQANEWGKVGAPVKIYN